MHQDNEALAIIVQADQRLNLECTEIDGKRTTIIHKGYDSRHLFEIEEFVKAIVDEELQKEFTRSLKTVAALGLALFQQYGFKVNNWLHCYTKVHRYSPRVEAFYKVCESMGLLNPSASCDFTLVGSAHSEANKNLLNFFTSLITRIYTYCGTYKYNESERLRKINGERNRQSVLAMEEEMFSKKNGRSRWLVLSLTLRYKSAYRHAITPEIIQQHRDRFFAAKRYNHLMAGIKNYVWTIEQGEKTGLHLHVILFYSSESNRDEYIAMQIGEYWTIVVTEGKGDYWNSNAGWLKPIYLKRGHGLGVGQINWDDHAKRTALRSNLAYLAKTDQYLMLKVSHGIRTFGTGQLFKKRKSGRPRIGSDVNLCLV